MYTYHTKYFTLGAIFFIGISLVFGVLSLREKPAQAQHIDIFGKLGKESPNSYHQSFAPYEGTVPIPWIDEKPTPITIKVTETITYEIPVDEKKFNEKKLTIEDLELKEVTNNSEINFHQVDCHFFKVIKQTQVRKAEGLTCVREREGTQYWLSDDKKYIEWGKWSNWKRKKPGEVEAEITED